MIHSPGFLFTILAFVLVIGPLVFVHEMGHYLAGRLFGVKAEAFSIGFGREIAGWTDKRGTRWKLGWLPLGGYVRFAGDMNAASQPDARMAGAAAGGARQHFPGQAGVAARDHRRGRAGRQFPASRSLILAGFACAYGDSRDADGRRRRHARQRRGGGRASQPGDRITAIGGRSVETFDGSGALRRCCARRARSTIDCRSRRHVDAR